MSCGVYQIRCLVNGKRYIGSSKLMEQRLITHRRMLAKGNHHSRKLQNAWNKHGGHNSVFEILEYCSGDTRVAREDLLIQEHDSFRNGYNGQPRALRFKELSRRERRERSLRASEQHRRGTLGRSAWLSDPRAVHQKIGAAHRGKKLSPSTIRKMKKSIMKLWTPERRRAQRKWAARNLHSKEVVDKIKRQWTPERRKRQSQLMKKNVHRRSE